MKNRHSLLFTGIHTAIATVLALSSASLQAQTKFWNASSGTWNTTTTNWNTATAGGGTQTTWATSNNATFDANATYAVTIGTAQTATDINIKAGAVTFDGAALVSSNNLIIDSGASLTAASAQFLKVGVTNLTVNGTLNLTTAAAGGNQVSIAGGSGSIVIAGNFRTNGNVTFAGNISGAGSIITQGGGTFTLSGNNTYLGSTLLRNGNVLRLDSTTALSASSQLRFGAGDNIVELAADNFSRTLGVASGVSFHNTVSDGAGNSGFAAVNADRTVALNGGTVWGGAANNFNPGVFTLGNANSTHKVTLTTSIDLNGAARTINSVNGAAAVEGEISGNLTGTGASGLIKAGSGTIALSGSNSYAGTTAVSAGTLSASNIVVSGGSSNLGNATSAVTLGAASTQGTLAYTGNNAIYTRGFTIGGAGGGRLDVTTSGQTLQVSTGDITGTGLFTVGGAGNTTINSNLTHTGGLTKADAGTLTLTSTSTYSGNIAISAGTLEFAPVSGTSTFTGAITGSGTIVKSDAGTTSISSSTATANTFSGAVIVNGGTLSMGAGARGLLSAGSLTVNSGGILLANGDAFGFSQSPALTVNAGGIFKGGVQRLGAVTLNGGTIDGTGGFQNVNFVFTQDVTVGGSSASIIQGNQGLALANDTALAGTTRTFTVADATASAAADLTISNQVRDSYVNNRTTNLQKSGVGTMLLSGANVYTGTTTVSAGTLLINGSLGDTAVTVANGATLGGSGAVGTSTVLNTFTVNGTLAPGNSPGILTINDNLDLNGTLSAELQGTTAGTGHDQLVVNGAVDITGSTLSALFDTFTSVNGNLLFILLNDGTDAITGTFSGLAQNATVINYGGFDWKISYNADSTANTFTGTANGNDIALMAIPEPRAALLGGLGLLCLLRRRRA